MESVKNRNVRRTAKVRISLLLLSALVSVFPSCKKECVCHLRSVHESALANFNLDWNGFNKENPTGVTLYTYHSVDEPLRKLSNNTLCIETSLDEGEYNVLAFNQSERDFWTLKFANLDDFENAYAFGNNPTDNLWHEFSNPTIYEPEWLASGYLNDIVVTKEMTTSIPQDCCTCSDCFSCCHLPVTPVNLGTIEMKNLIWEFVTVVHVKGINSLAQIRAAIDGMSSGVILKDGAPLSDPTVQTLSQWRIVRTDSDNGYLTSTIRCFGLSGTQKIQIQLMLVNGKNIVQKTIDCTELITTNNNEKKYRLEFEIEDRLPEVENTGNAEGFNPSVGDWGPDVEIDIIM